MNNWRLLLLAVVAVFQPIASFTNTNLIDGRQQCCDRSSSAHLQDTRSSLHGTYQLGKTTSALRRLNDRDETREDLRYELRQRDSILSRSSPERPLVDFRGKAVRQGPSEVVRSSRVEHRPQYFTKSPSHELQLDGHQREETTRFIRGLKQQDITRRTVDRSARDALERRNDRVYAYSPQESSFRDEYRTERFGNERLSRNLIDSQREMHREQIRSVDRRITLNRDERRVVSRTQDDVSVEGSNNINNRQHITRERMSAVRRESLIRPDTRRYSEHNNERRDLQRDNEQRLPLSANTRLVDRIRDVPIRFNANKDTRENRQRIRTNQRLSIDINRREHKEERRDTRQQNKENIERSASGERRTLVARRITRESRIINVLNNQNDRDVDDQRVIKHERMPREIQEKIRESPEHRLTRERIHMDQRNIRESRLMNAQSTREDADRREIRKNSHMDRRNIRESRIINAENTREVIDQREHRQDERMTRQIPDENRGNPKQRLARERIQTDRRDIRKSGLINARSTRDVADRREIRQNERLARDTWEENNDQSLYRERNNQMGRRDIRESRVIIAQSRRDISGQRRERQIERLTRETRDGKRENQEQRLSRERIQMDRRDIRESRVMNDRNMMNVADRREIRQNERMTRVTGDENKENQEKNLSRERIQTDRRDIRESRVMNGRNTMDAADHREIRQNEKMTRETGDENRKNQEQKLTRETREKIQVDRRDIREFRLMNARNAKDTAERRDIRHNERMTRDIREVNRDNVEQKLSRERNQMDRRDIRESRLNARNTRVSADQRENRQYEKMTRETRDENRENREKGLSREEMQMDRRDIRESKLTNARITRDVANRLEVRNNERLTRGARDENRNNLELRLSRERIQMDRRNIREFGNMNIATPTERDVENQRTIRTNTRLHTDNREKPDHILARERIQMERNIRESRIMNTRNDLGDRAQETRQVDRVTGNERSINTYTENRRERSNNERLSGQIRNYRVTRQGRVDSKSSDRVYVERDRSMMERRAHSADSRNYREISAKTRLSQSADSERRSEVSRSRVELSPNIENREREIIDARSRNINLVRNRERNSMMMEKMEPENDFTVANWQYVLYTLQAAYLCALFMQMLSPSRIEKTQKMRLRWLPASSHYNPIKVD